MRAKIKTGRDRIAHKGKFLTTIHRGFRGIHGKKEVWEMVKRNIHGRIVGVVAITPKNEVVMNKIYRVPLKSYVLEFPAGLSDKKGESEVALARRELLEETGYVAEKLELLVRTPVYAGLVEDEMAIYLATDVKKLMDPDYENAEDIGVITIPLSKLYRYLTHPPKDLVIDMKIFGALYLLERKGYRIR